MTIADIINGELDLKAKIQGVLNTLNAACITHQRSPRDAGVVNPMKIATDPLRVLSADLDDSELAIITVLGAGLSEPLSTEAGAAETIWDWLNYTLLEKLPA